MQPPEFSFLHVPEKMALSFLFRSEHFETLRGEENSNFGIQG